MIIATVCNDPALVRILQICQGVLQVIQIAGPISAIIGLTLALFKLMGDPDNKKYKNFIRNWAISFCLFLLIPAIINLSMKLIGDTSFGSCWETAKSSKKITPQIIIPPSGQEESGGHTGSTGSGESGSSSQSGGSTGSGSKTDRAINIVSTLSFKSYGDYSLYIPANATRGMPMLVLLPAVDNDTKSFTNVFKNWNLDDVDAFILVPNYPKNYKNTRNIILRLIDSVGIDKNRIYASGFSSSGTYVYYLVGQNKDLFAAMIVLSSGATCSYINQNGRDFWNKLPIRAFGERGGRYDGNGRACPGWTNWSPSTAMSAMKNCMGNRYEFYDLGKMCHSDVMNYVFKLDSNGDKKSDNFEWLLNQSR